MQKHIMKVEILEDMNIDLTVFNHDLKRLNYFFNSSFRLASFCELEVELTVFDPEALNLVVIEKFEHFT